jgi:hypothetical protein
LRAHADQWHVMQPMFGEPMTVADLEPSPAPAARDITS